MGADGMAMMVSRQSLEVDRRVLLVTAPYESLSQFEIRLMADEGTGSPVGGRFGGCCSDHLVPVD
jgi:hypothetical protein